MLAFTAPTAGGIVDLDSAASRSRGGFAPQPQSSVAEPLSEMSLPGILLVLGAIAGGFAMAGGHFPVLLQPSEFVVILGAAVGTLMTSSPGLM